MRNDTRCCETTLSTASELFVLKFLHRLQDMDKNLPLLFKQIHVYLQTVRTEGQALGPAVLMALGTTCTELPSRCLNYTY